MLVRNYQMQDGEFQSIYNLHEYLIALAAKAAPGKRIAEDPRMQRLDQLFENESQRELAKKDVNYQNCRKSAFLSRLYLRHKANLTLEEKEDCCEILCQYITMFKELASLVFDLGIFLHSATDACKNKLTEIYQPLIAAEQDPVRKCRLVLNQVKLH